MFHDEGYTIKKYKIMYDYQLHSSILSVVDHCKYLGVVLQSNLQWSKHNEATQPELTLLFVYDVS